MRAIPTDQLAQRVGASEDETRQAVRTALPALLAGLGANAQQPQVITPAITTHLIGGTA